MTINILAIKSLIKEKFHNNQTYFAEELNVNRTYLNQVLNGKNIESKKIVNAIILYCKRNNINYSQYIFLP